MVNSLAQNLTIKEVDLSHNKLGEAETLNSVMPDITTGGEAIGEWLEQSTCHIESLDLSW